MAKKKKSSAGNKRLKTQIKDLRDIERRLERVRKSVQTFLKQSARHTGPGGGPESLRPR